MDELMCTVASFFRNVGKNVVTDKEFTMEISLRYKWMPPADADRLLAVLLEKGHLEKDGEYLRPKFDVHATDVPFGFRPSADTVKALSKSRPSAAPADDLLSRLMARAESAGIKKKDFIVSVNAVQKRLNVDIEIAALLMLREKNIDISEYCGTAYDTVMKR
ncbi:MAG: DUF2240 family protein [Methanomassiliicoccaceae archaeon]|jgi:hypothetical protein|nr:DUF2240 family protein [Methanomassiliicoccaceae archaeon]